ncbi:unnamed protein product [Hapterophycus canaliculatus]
MEQKGRLVVGVAERFALEEVWGIVFLPKRKVGSRRYAFRWEQSCLRPFKLGIRPSCLEGVEKGMIIALRRYFRLTPYGTPGELTGGDRFEAVKSHGCTKGTPKYSILLV